MSYKINPFLDELDYHDGEDVRPSVLTRNASGFVTKKEVTGGLTWNYTRDANNFVTSKSNGTTTWTYVRNASNQITSTTVA